MKGEIISLIVAVSWTITALCAEFASKRIGQLATNVIRMAASLLLLALTLWVTCGEPFPQYTTGETWLWLSLSGFVGYVLGDYCLFNSYILIGSRFGQLFMTLAPPSAAIFGWILLGQSMSMLAIIGMFVTIFGIGMSILSREDGKKVHVKLPLRGILYGIGAGMGQGVGLVLSAKGMTYYEANIPADASIAVDMMPFASTFIRAITGLAGFVVAMILTKQSKHVLRAAKDTKSMLCMGGATFFGPFFGVSLSLMATLYTSAGIAQTIMAITPVLILYPSYLLYHQKVTQLEVAGSIISVAGVALFFV